jgi:hypothetical protein
MILVCFFCCQNCYPRIYNMSLFEWKDEKYSFRVCLLEVGVCYPSLPSDTNLSTLRD